MRVQHQLRVKKKNRHAVKQHMQEWHQDQLDIFQLQRNRAELEEKKVFIVPRDEDVANANDMLALWLASSCIPIRLVEDVEFKEYIACITQKISRTKLPLPGRTEVKVAITRVASRIRTFVKNELRSDCYYYCVTTDMWTNLPGRSYISFTLHYLTSSFELRNRTLKVVQFNKRHTGDAIADALKSIMNEWGLSREHCVKLLRDGASNAVTSGNHLSVGHMSCVAHCFHLIVGGALIKKRGKKSAAELLSSATNTNEFAVAHAELVCEELDHVLERELFIEKSAMDTVRLIVQKFHAIAVYIHRSSKGSHRLKQFQESLGVKQLTVVLDCPTRWNSCRDMLLRMKSIRKSIAAFLIYAKEEYSDFKLEVPTEGDWLVIRCLLVLLEPFLVATKWLSSSKHPTLAMMYPTIRSIRVELEKDSLSRIISDHGHLERIETIEVLMTSLRQSFIKLFDARFSGMDQKLTWISALDPRLRGLTFLSENQKTECQKELNKVLVASIPNYLPEDGDDESEEESIDSEMPTSKKMRRSMDVTMFGTVQDDTRGNPKTMKARCAREVKKYFEEKPTNRADDPLAWWSSRRGDFPLLARLARKWLCCLATTVPSERAFSTAQNVVSAKRCSLTQDTVRDLVFVAEIRKPHQLGKVPIGVDVACVGADYSSTEDNKNTDPDDEDVELPDSYEWY